MAIVTLVVSGMAPKAFTTEAETVRDLLEDEGIEGEFTVRVNNQASTMDHLLADGNYVVLGEKLKGN